MSPLRAKVQCSVALFASLQESSEQRKPSGPGPSPPAATAASSSAVYANSESNPFAAFVQPAAAPAPPPPAQQPLVRSDLLGSLDGIPVYCIPLSIVFFCIHKFTDNTDTNKFFKILYNNCSRMYSSAGARCGCSRGQPVPRAHHQPDSRSTRLAASSARPHRFHCLSIICCCFCTASWFAGFTFLRYICIASSD